MSRYPFTSRREVADRLAKDAGFVRNSVRLLQERTLAKTGGFMASHRSKATTLLAELDALGDEAVLARGVWLASYARTLSRLMREERLRADPALGAIAAIFGVMPAAVVDPRDLTTRASGDRSTQDVITPEVAGVALKRKGRPAGSKNRPKQALESVAPRRRARG